VAENRREEQKLWLILFQIKAIRMRLNLLVLQYWVFSSLAVLIAGGALFLWAASRLQPLSFLLVAVTAFSTAIVALTRIARTALHDRASYARAALIADDRGALKGRLATVQALATNPPASSLWQYLLEETYGLRSEFEPAQIEPRWLSRSLFSLLGVCAAIFVLLVILSRSPQATPGPLAQGGDMAVDLSDLDIRPADPSVKPNAHVEADSETMKQLSAKAADAARHQNRQGLSSLMDKARRLASNLQDQVTGNENKLIPPIHLRGVNKPATAPPADNAAGARSGSAPTNANNSSPINSNGAGTTGQSDAKPPAELGGSPADQMASNAPGMPAPSGPNQKPGDPSNMGTSQQGGAGNVAGANHSGGSDAEHLFGAPQEQTLGSDSFHMTVDALPSDEASSKGAPGYVPPKVQVPLNSHQAPDEPLARAEVPSDDRMTIKRVFER